MTTQLQKLLIENQIITPTFLHYGGLAGVSQYGINGCIIKRKFLDMWRSHFLCDNIFEVETGPIVPYDALKASGHVDKFDDMIIKINDTVKRADHVVKDYMKENKIDVSGVDNWTLEQLEKYINDNGKAIFGDDYKEYLPVTKKNLMFGLPDGSFLRPELAQSIFPHFKTYYDYQKQKLPFGIAQIGNSFRNEINTKQFTRMRCFNQIEIEYFYDPIDPTHCGFERLSELQIPIYSSDMQLNNFSTEFHQRGSQMMTLQEAYDNKIIPNQILAYFLGKIYEFALSIGLNKDKIRFRQHLPTEKAHYSNGCFDLECFVDDDWLECIGTADRGDYDLKCHSKANSLLVKSNRTEEVKKLVLNVAMINKTYRSKAKKLLGYLETLNPDNFKVETIDLDGDMYEITNDIAKVVTEQVPVMFYPHVIEPSFGELRLLYAVFNHAYYLRKDSEKREVLGLPRTLAPYDIAVFQLSNKPELLEYVKKIKELINPKLRIFIDSSGSSIGSKYVRSDELGIKYAITIDFDTLKDKQVTIRERDSMVQTRESIHMLREYFSRLFWL